LRLSVEAPRIVGRERSIENRALSDLLYPNDLAAVIVMPDLL